MTRLDTMTIEETKTRLAKKPIAILPLGATEQHGPHLPMGTDTFLAEAMAEKLAAKLDGIILPTIPFGYSWVWSGLPGTITVRHETLEAFLSDVCRSVEQAGFGMLLIINGHESNTTSIKFVVRQNSQESDFPILRIFYPDLSRVREEHCESPTWFGMIHACEFETSLMLAVQPDKVDMSKAVREYPSYNADYFLGCSPLSHISESGVFGDATLASTEKGEAMLDEFIQITLSHVRSIKFGGTNGE